MALWRSLRSGGQEPPTERKDAVTRRHSAGPYYQFTGAPYSPPLGDLDLDRAVESQWGRVVWVYRAIDARAKNLARLTVRVNTGRGKDAMEIENHPLAILLNRQANRYESGTSFRYRFSTLADLSKRGVFVEVVENNSGLSEVHLLNPKHTFPIPDADKFVSGYQMRLPSGETFDLKPYKQGKGGVLWFRRPHPTDPYSSQTWLDAAGISIDLDHYARVYNRNFLANDGKPGGVLVVKSEEGVDDQVAAELQARFAGGPQQAGRVSVLEADDLEYVDMSTTPRDAQYVESRALSKGEILGAAGTPESLWNASGRTFDNADAELEGWWRNDMVPEAEAIAAFWEQLTPGGAVDDTEVVSYAWEDITVLNRDEREQEARLQAEWAAGTISLDEYRAKTGKEPLELPGSRVVWLTAGKAPVGQPEDVAAIMGQGQEAAPPEGGEVPPGEAPPGEPPPENGPPADGTEPPAEFPTGEDPVGDALLDIELKALPSEVGEPDPFARQRAAQAALVDTWVNACSDEIATLLRRQEKVILTRLTGAKARKHTRHWKPKNDTAPTRELKALDPEYIVDRRRWIDEVIAAIGDIVRAAFGAAGDRVLAALTGEGGFDPNTDAANEAVAKTVRIIAEGFDARAGRLQEVVSEGDAAGKSIDEIAADVQEAFTQAQTWADVTSRQVVGAMNAAQQIAAVDSGATRKRWLATDDERTRESHRDAEGQVVDIDEPFQVGEGMLMFPGDPTGPIGEWINCRCTMLFQSPERDFDAELDADLAALDALEGEAKALIGRAARTIAGAFGSFDVRFDPSAHPRDHRGRFVDTPDVILPDGTRGVAVSENDNGTITVAKPTGAVVNVDPAKVTDPPKPKPKPASASFRPLTGGLVSANVTPTLRRARTTRESYVAEVDGATIGYVDPARDATGQRTGWQALDPQTRGRVGEPQPSREAAAALLLTGGLATPNLVPTAALERAARLVDTAAALDTSTPEGRTELAAAVREQTGDLPLRDLRDLAAGMGVPTPAADRNGLVGQVTTRLTDNLISPKPKPKPKPKPRPKPSGTTFRPLTGGFVTPNVADPQVAALNRIAADFDLTDPEDRANFRGAVRRHWQDMTVAAAQDTARALGVDKPSSSRDEVTRQIADAWINRPPERTGYPGDARRAAASQWAAESGIADWETTKPWNASRDDVVAGRVPGIRYDRDAVRGFTAHWVHDPAGIVVNDTFFDGSESSKRALLYHEAGHPIAGEMLAGRDANDVLADFRSDSTAGFTSPFGPGAGVGTGGYGRGNHEDQPSEILSDAYMALANGTAGYYKGDAVDRLFAEVAATAARLGFPTRDRNATPRETFDEYRKTGDDVWERRPTGDHGIRIQREGRGKYRWYVHAGVRPDGTERNDRGDATTVASARQAADASYARLSNEPAAEVLPPPIGTAPIPAEDLVSENVYMWHGRLRTVPPEVAKQGVQAVEDYLRAEEAPTMGDLITPNMAVPSLSWQEVKDKYPLYAEYGMNFAVAELANNGENYELDDVFFTEETIDPSEVVFQRYPVSDSRMQSLRDAYRNGEAIPPVMLVSRGGELLTADGHHRLSAEEALGIPAPALIAHSSRQDKYQGGARVGELRRKPDGAAFAAATPLDAPIPLADLVSASLWAEGDTTGRIPDKVGEVFDTWLGPATVTERGFKVTLNIEGQDPVTIEVTPPVDPSNRRPGKATIVDPGLVTPNTEFTQGAWEQLDDLVSANVAAENADAISAAVRGEFMLRPGFDDRYEMYPRPGDKIVVEPGLDYKNPDKVGWLAVAQSPDSEEGDYRDSENGSSDTIDAAKWDAVGAYGRILQEQVQRVHEAEQRRQDTAALRDGVQRPLDTTPEGSTSFYRGVIIDGGHGGNFNPDDDAAVIARLRRGDQWPMFGEYWSAGYEQAEDFSVGEASLSYVWSLGNRPSEPVYGVVLEAQAEQEHTKSDSPFAMTSLGEDVVVGPDRRNTSKVLAHLYRMEPGDEPRERTYVRTIEVPREKWDPRPDEGLVSENTVMVEAGTFHPEDHPIDTFGNFQEAPLVRLPDGRTGMATRSNLDGTVVVIGPDGESSDMRPEDLTEVHEAGFRSDLLAPNALVSSELGGFRGTLAVLAHGIMDAFWALETGGADDEPPGEVNVIAEVPAAPSNLPIPERFRARYRNQYLLAANVDTVGGEALSRIPDLRELMGRGMDPGEARAEHHRLYDEEVRKVSAERAALQNAVQQDVLTDFDELPEGVDALQYLDAGGDKPRAIYGLSHNEAVALGSAGLAPGPGAVRDWVGGFSTWAVPAERLDDGEMVPFRGVPIQGRTIPFGYVTKIDGMPILVEAGTEEAARERAALVAENWKIATADVNSDLVLESTVGLAWTQTPLRGDPFGFSSIIATGGDGTITFWDFPPDTHTLRHEAAHNIDNYDKRENLMAPRKAYRDEWVETVAADRQVFKDFLSVTHNHWEGFREAETDHPIVWEPPDRELDPVAHGLDGNSPGEGLTDYGRAAVVEDYAESAALYLRDRRYGQLATAEVRGPEYDGIAFPVRFADMHPHRARYFDRIYGLDPAPISMLQVARLDSLTRDRGPMSEWSDNQLMVELRMHGIDPSDMSRDAMLEALAGIPGVGMYMEA